MESPLLVTTENAVGTAFSALQPYSRKVCCVCMASFRLLQLPPPIPKHVREVNLNLYIGRRCVYESNRLCLFEDQRWSEHFFKELCCSMCLYSTSASFKVWVLHFLKVLLRTKPCSFSTWSTLQMLYFFLFSNVLDEEERGRSLCCSPMELGGGRWRLLRKKSSLISFICGFMCIIFPF